MLLKYLSHAGLSYFSRAPGVYRRHYDWDINETLWKHFKYISDYIYSELFTINFPPANFSVTWPTDSLWPPHSFVLLGWPKKLVQVFLPGKPKWTFLANSIFRSSVDRMMPLALVRASSLLLLPIDILITSRKHPHRLTQKWCFAGYLGIP